MIRRFGLPLVLLLSLVLLVPTSLTAAYLTAERTAEQTTGGVGRWCSVPTPEKQSNVYRLSDMPYYSSSESSLAIVPVVNNGEYGPTGGTGRLGVRLWTCNANLASDSHVKVTAWRNEGDASANKVWLPPRGESFASHRLDPTQGFGQEITELHRTGSNPGGGANIVAPDRSRYSWIVSSDRTKSNRTASDTCRTTTLCIIDVDAAPTFANGFNSDTSGSRSRSNSVEYLASGFWAGSGQFSPGDPKDVNLDVYPETAPRPPFSNGQGPSSTDGRQIQWVIMEWWGSTTPSDDMVVEVFVR